MQRVPSIEVIRSARSPSGAWLWRHGVSHLKPSFTRTIRDGGSHVYLPCGFNDVGEHEPPSENTEQR